jgi:hypothetical protein
MRKGFLLILIIILIGIAGIIWRFAPKPPQNNPQSPTVAPFTQSSQNNEAKQIVQKPPAPSHTVTASNPTIPPAVMEYVKKIKADPQYDWKQPINFWGKVVDESNKPVSEASVHFVWNDISAKGTSDADMVSDGNGFFSLTDRRGKYLYVTVRKQGYYDSHQNGGFEYANPADGLFTPDQNNPVVFHLRKKGQGADLIHGSQLFGFRTNGPVQYLDLLQAKNTLSPPGDLTAQITREPRNADAKFNWSVTISVPDGGLLETNEEFMFEAPTDGYQQSIEVQMTTNDLNWTAGAKMRFYFKSRNGSIYGWAEATIYPQYQKAAAIDMDYYVNPTGSRNLEPDN